MSITSGTRIGPYEVTTPLGEGGMGVVYRARDTKLQRDVALKFLPDHFASDPERLSRFQREAQVLASLNHPNIAQIYGLEQTEGAGCIVMELVEGETLAERIQRGAIPLTDALPIATQVVDALEAAHERGVMHRDLKPANIKLTPAGHVKVLDFGLAKVLGNAEPNTDPANSPTLMSGSMPGMILGTAAYMSPEQARGKSVDARTDIWAFGCVLYEMLCGRRVFEGELATDSIAKIIAGEPHWSALPAETPGSIRTLLRAALQKDPKQRLQHIHDSRLFLQPALTPEAAAALPAPPPAQPNTWRLVAAALAVALVAALVPAVRHFTEVTPEAPEMRFEMPAPGFIQGPAIAPDGQRIAYVAANDGKQLIWIRPIGSLAARSLAGTDNATGLFWSPDSRYLGFFSNGKLNKIDITGGGPQPICDAAITAPGAWNSDNVILFAGFAGGKPGIDRVSASGGEVTAVTTADAPKEFLHLIPQFLPDGHHFLYHALGTERQTATVYVGSLDSKSRTRVFETQLLPGNSQAVYTPPGYLLFSRDRALMAQPFDAAPMTLNGEQTLVVSNVAAEFSVSNTGVLVYRNATDSAGPQSTDQLAWADRKGKPIGKIPMPGPVGSLRLSRDGQQLAIDTNGANTNSSSDIWVVGVTRAVPTRITTDPAFEGYPVWSPDGSRVVYSANRNNNINRLFQKSANGIGAEDLLLPGTPDEVDVAYDWSVDGRYVMFERFKLSAAISPDLWVLPQFGDKMASVFVHNSFAKVQPQISPDGKYVAYATNESGSFQIVVQTFPDPSKGRTTITAKGGTEPRWRRDGRELYYLAQDGNLMAVPIIKTEPNFEPGPPAALFQTNLVPQQPLPFTSRYDVTADGQRFVIVPASPAAPANPNGIPITAVVNWTAALRKK